MDLMIDIESLGIKNNCPVISIGACFFDKYGIKEKFYAVLDVAEQIDSGKRVADASTIKWWMSQEGAAKKIFKDETGVMTDERINELEFVGAYVGIDHTRHNASILEKFSRFCKQYENCKPWGKGPTFDIVIMESLLMDYGVEIPWNFRNIRDLRTFEEYVYDGSDTKRKGTHHNALDDALHQAQVVIDGLNKKELVNQQEKDNNKYKLPKLPFKDSFVAFLADFKASRSK